jgi:O-antigen ligase
MTSDLTPASSDPLKYARGAGPRVEGRGPRILEVVTCAHVAILLLGAAWWFGGMSDFSRRALGAWGSLSLLILFASFNDRYAWRERGMSVLPWLVPIGLFNLITLAGALNPGFRRASMDGDSLLIPIETSIWLPTSVESALTLEALWIFNTLWLSAFNLALIVRKRKTLRLLLTLLVVNAVVLAVFGTVQKFSGATGLFFDAVRSPQPKFFASFVYHNHWGSYTVLMLATCLGLIWHQTRRKGRRDFFHSPAFAGVVVLLILAATLPLSLSRSTTLVGIALLAGAFAHVMAKVIAKRRRYRESILPPVLGLVTAVVLACAGIWSVARDSITVRLEKTREQIAEMRAAGSIGGRAKLYRDTVRMGEARPIFGWGMASYPHVFTLYNTTDSPLDRLPVFFQDAHSDWLQAFAEHGAVGTLLLGLCALVPLRAVRWRHIKTPLPAYLLSGCALLALYAWIEFPFGNTAVVLYWWTLFFCAVQYCRLIDREERKAAPPA